MRLCNKCRMERKFEFLEMHLVHGLPVDQAATFAGVHRATMYRWLGQYEEGGFDGLADTSRAPKTHPNTYDDYIVELIKFLRKETKGACADIIKIKLKKQYNIIASRSGVAGVIRREGLVNPI